MCLRFLWHHILSLIAHTFRESQDFVFIIIVQFMMSASGRIRFCLQIVFVCLYVKPSHYHHRANFPELKKCLSDIFCRVCKIKHILQVIYYTLYGAMCFQFTHFPCDDWETVQFVLSSSNRTAIHLGLGHETMVCAVCLSIFLLINLVKQLLELHKF